MGGLEDARHLFLVGVERAGDEACAGAEREAERGQRRVDRTLRRRRRTRAELAGRRVLALGQAVDLVIEQQQV